MGGGKVLRADRGAVSVEFFLVLPLVVLVLVASLQVVSIGRARIELGGAVREGVRVAATTPDPAQAVAAVQAALPSSMRERVRVSVSRPSVVGEPARVTARLRHPLGTPFPSEMAVELSASAVMRVER